MANCEREMMTQAWRNWSANPPISWSGNERLLITSAALKAARPDRPTLRTLLSIILHENQCLHFGIGHSTMRDYIGRKKAAVG